MNNDNASPLNHLAAFAITFVAGALTTLGMGAYKRYVDEQARKEQRVQATNEDLATPAE